MAVREEAMSGTGAFRPSPRQTKSTLVFFPASVVLVACNESHTAQALSEWQHVSATAIAQPFPARTWAVGLKPGFRERSPAVRGVVTGVGFLLGNTDWPVVICFAARRTLLVTLDTTALQ